MEGRAGLGFAAVAALGVVMLTPVVGPFVALVGFASSPEKGCAGAASAPESPSGPVAGFDAAQTANAAQIVAAATDEGLPAAAALLGVQCAIGESMLRVIDFGDGAGPDSRGLFQQRANGAWGSYEDRMNPRISARNFFRALKQVPGWEGLAPSLAINRVQRNADPGHYTKFRAQAESLVGSLGLSVPASGMCTSGSVVGELAGKWVNPLPGAVLTSGYGPRATPAGTADLGAFHYGLDLATPGRAGTVLACTDLLITVASDLDSGTGAGTHIKGQTLDGKLTISFNHMEKGSLKVKVGDTVAAATPLGTEGATGNVNGRHCHIEFFMGRFEDPWVPIDPTTDPAPVFASKGITW